MRLRPEREDPILTTSLFFGTTEMDRHRSAPSPEPGGACPEVEGWLAISEMHIVLGRGYSPEVKKWLDDLLAGRPYQRIGKSIRLYYFE